MFPFHRVVESLRSSRPLQDVPGGVRWVDHDGHTELTMRTLDEVTPDGYHVDEEVTVTHYSPAFSDVSYDEACAVNRLATCAALVSKSDEEPGRFVSRLRVIRGDAGPAEHAYGPLLYIQAAMVGQHAALLARDVLEWDPERSVLVGPSDLCALPKEDFEALVPVIQMKGLAYVVEPAGRGVTAELPWDPGAYSAACRMPEFAARLRADGFTEEQVAVMAGRTSLLTITLDEPHPLFGHGLRYRLELGAEAGRAASLIASFLNRVELARADLPPLLGAWCEGPRALMFHGFIPNQAAMRRLPEYVLGWLLGRHAAVRDVLTRLEESVDSADA